MSGMLYLNAFLSLLAIIGLILFLAWLVRRFGLGAMAPKATQQKRLRVVAALGIDSKRRLMLVSCDDKEHLLLVGGNTDLLIESMPKKEEEKADED
ncbi:MAG: flagellar biosynthetic protein FliO [Alphaproteobacteria bacterium]|nr:flagellar biosynthetic protein FliO [Alphaproteobacteria bacterium]